MFRKQGKSAMPRPPSQQRIGRTVSTHTLIKPLTRHIRLRRLYRLLPFVITGTVFFVLFVIPMFTSHGHGTGHGKIGPESITPIGKTSIGTPILPLPAPYGFAKGVMASVLPKIDQYLRGGSHIVQRELMASVDDEHLHGSLIGHFPDSHKAHWNPITFDFESQTPEMKEQAHSNTSFNKVMSNSLPLDRWLPDVRPEKCQIQWYYNMSGNGASHADPTARFPSMRTTSHAHTDEKDGRLAASIVIIFYNEPLSTLLRSTHSVLNRTPPHLLHEIILVDDGSDKNAPWLSEGDELEQHIQLLPKTYVARLKGRNGLMLARNVGAALATGDVIVFLDSHVEATAGWLEPLIGRIQEGMENGINHVVVPAIDNIDADSFNFSKGGIDILGHSWGLGQVGITNRFDPKSPDAMPSPIMAGGLLAVSRAYFDQLGFYDPEMELWGGEEMEISFRIWLCGGTLECMPCSRVGHVFRSSKFWQGQVYKVPGGVIARNRRRASFWMDEYGALAHLSSAPLPKNRSLGSMAFYEEVKERMKCKPFRWYLQKINPTLWESANRLFGEGHTAATTDIMSLFRAYGFLRNPHSKACVDHLHHTAVGTPFGVYPCHYLKGSQSMVQTKDGLLLPGERLLEGCLTRDDEGFLRQEKCEEDKVGQQRWEMMKKGPGVVFLKGEGLCLTVTTVPEEEDKSPFSLRMKPCGGENRKDQEWEWESELEAAGRDVDSGDIEDDDDER